MEFFVMWQLLSWRDGIELISFIGIAALFVRWLQRDNRALLEYVCFYYVLCFIVWLMHLPALFVLLIGGLPCGVALVMMFHKQSLQRALIATHVVERRGPDAWVDQLIKCSINSFQYPMLLTWIIEQEYPLEGCLHAGILLHAELSLPLFNLIAHYYAHESALLLWIDRNGMLKRIQPGYSAQIKSHEQLDSLQYMPLWQQYGMVMSSVCDAYTIQADAATRSFTIIAQKKRHVDLSSQHARTFLKHLLSPTIVTQESTWLNSSSTVSDRVSRFSSGRAL